MIQHTYGIGDAQYTTSVKKGRTLGFSSMSHDVQDSNRGSETQNCRICEYDGGWNQETFADDPLRVATAHLKS
jgi:hypothetical protein